MKFQHSGFIRSFFIFLILSAGYIFSQDNADIKRLETFYEYVMFTPDSVEKDPQQLVNYLITLADNDREKIEVIYCWIIQNISYNFDQWNGNPEACIETDAVSVLQNRYTVCEGYSELFAHLCRLAGFECEIISGWVKPGGFGLNTDKMNSHTWNRVKLNDEWKLVDVTYGSGYGYRENGKWVFKRSFKPGYLFIPPEKMIKTHFPVLPEWQLLDPLLSKDEFTKGN